MRLDWTLKTASSTAAKSRSTIKIVDAENLVQTISAAAESLGLRSFVAATCTASEADRAIEPMPDHLSDEYEPITIIPRRFDTHQMRRGKIALLKAMIRLEAQAEHTSKSHAADLSVAICLAKSESVLGVGIDLEPASRKISSRLHRRLRSRYGSFKGTELELWCALEAIYKADPQQQPSGLFAYTLSEGGFMRDEVSFALATLCVEGHVVALAAAYALKSS